MSSSPHHHKSNGKVESAVKVAKYLLKKAQKDNKDPWLAILDQRNTPSEVLGTSPAQRLMNRRTRTLLPTATNLLYPKVPVDVNDKLKWKRQKAKWYHDRSARALPEIEVGQEVRVYRKMLSDRSYLVKTSKRSQVICGCSTGSK